MNYQPYIQEIFPDNLKYLKDTQNNRVLVGNILGKASLEYVDISYIEIDLNDNSWRTCFNFEWLYRNTPPLITVEELKNILDERKN